jgi:hypothetical protein
LSFADVGIPGNVSVRDLWQHADLGQMNSISVDVPPHGVMMLRLANTPSTCRPQSITFNPIADWTYNQPAPVLSAAATSGLPVQYEVAFGPATTARNQVLPTGQPGTVFVVARQPGNSANCAAIPQVRSFNATGPHQDNMFLFGTFTSWTPIRMHLQEGLWVADNVSMPAGTQQLKFANTNNFSGTDWGDAQGLTGTATVTTGGKPNIQVPVPFDGFYRFIFNDVTLEYVIQEEPGLRATTSRR